MGKRFSARRQEGHETVHAWMPIREARDKMVSDARRNQKEDGGKHAA
ncbi:hypothetical protein B4135_1089 [Caldibacillus debilis]|uniref:Uncharacterized protein n=1 Tax=Caldibacillus debilis TaxID=301148 RepID=A0A150MDS2_9BACI|nr:hypothetical protein B4135_1089 [Caldibacillus debilis]